MHLALLSPRGFVWTKLSLGTLATKPIRVGPIFPTVAAFALISEEFGISLFPFKWTLLNELNFFISYNGVTYSLEYLSIDCAYWLP